mgnify:CR=1 FL=1
MAFIDSGINTLKNGDYEGGGLAGTGLSLSNHVFAGDAGQNCSLLDRRGLLETVGVDASEKLVFQTHLVEGVDIEGALGFGERKASKHRLEHMVTKRADGLGALPRFQTCRRPYRWRHRRTRICANEADWH